MQTTRQFLSILLLISLVNCNYLKAIVLPDTQVVVQQIRYFSNDAKEVYIVWGIKNGNLPDEELRPEGSFVKENCLFTPMRFDKNVFFVNLSLPPNTNIDYRFWISKGPLNKDVDIWDINSSYQKDYHAVVLNDNILLINSRVTVRPKTALSILDFSIPFLSITCTLLLLLLLIRENWFNEIKFLPTPEIIIISGGIILVLVLTLIRSSVMGFSWDLYLHPFLYFPKLIWAGFYDLIYVAIICGAFLVLSKIFPHKTAGKIIISSFVFIGMISIILALLNIYLVEIIGEPLSFQRPYLVDRSLLPELTISTVIQTISLCCSALFAGILLSYVSDLIMKSVTIKYAVVSSLVCFSFIYLTIAPKAILHYSWGYEKMANPVVSFFENRKITPENKFFAKEISDSLKLNITKNTMPFGHHSMIPE